MSDRPPSDSAAEGQSAKRSSLGATELAFRAGRLFVDQGICRDVFLMLYRATELDTYHVEAHETLSV